MTCCSLDRRIIDGIYAESLDTHLWTNHRDVSEIQSLLET